SKEGRIEGGTVEAICHEVLFGKRESQPEHDDDVLRVFCSTIGFWAPPNIVFVELRRLAAAGDVRERLVDMIDFWCRQTPSLFLDRSAKEGIMHLIDVGLSKSNNEEAEM